MVNGLSARAVTHAVFALALIGCGAPVDSTGVGVSSAGGVAGALAAAGSPSGGLSAGGAATGGSGGAAAGSAGTGGAGAGQQLTLNFSWSTYWLKGTTKTPITCADLGVQTVSFSIGGDALASAEKVLIPNAVLCDKGTFQNYVITLPPGEYSLGVSLSAGLASDLNLKSLVSGLSSFTVAPGTTHVDIPEVKLVRIMLPLSWSIEKAGIPSTCASVGATEVALVLAEVREDFMNTISWSEPCTLSPSQPLAKPGNYQLTATLKNDSSALATWTAPEMLSFSNESGAIPPAITFKVP